MLTNIILQQFENKQTIAITTIFLYDFILFILIYYGLIFSKMRPEITPCNKPSIIHVATISSDTLIAL